MWIVFCDRGASVATKGASFLFGVHERPLSLAGDGIDVAGGRIDEAFDRLLGLVRRTSGEDRNRARVHLVSLFDVFPPKDSRVAKARARLSSLLF